MKAVQLTDKAIKVQKKLEMDERLRLSTKMLNELRYVRMVSSSHLQLFKEGVNGLLAYAKSKLVQAITPMLSPDAQPSTLKAALDSNLDIFAGVQTEKQERAVLQQLLSGGTSDSPATAWLEPSRRDLVDPTGRKTGDFMYDFPVDALLRRLILNNPLVSRAPIHPRPRCCRPRCCCPRRLPVVRSIGLSALLRASLSARVHMPTPASCPRVTKP